MKAARSGGWIDSNSGSELEIALEQSPHGSQAQAHPSRNGSTPQSINNSQHQHPFYIKDGGISARRDGEAGEDHPAHSNLNFTSVPLASNSRSMNPRAGASLQPSHPFYARLSWYFLRISLPYLRHHFKWEYLPPSTMAEGAPKPALQPRFVESSSPPHSLNYDETHWPRGFHAKELACPNEASKFHSKLCYSHEVQRPAHLASNLGFAINNRYQSVSRSAAAHPKSRLPSQQCFEPGASTMGLPSNHMDCFNQPAFGPSQKPWGIAAPPQESKPLNQNALNLASVTSVPFSLAPQHLSAFRPPSCKASPPVAASGQLSSIASLGIRHSPASQSSPRSIDFLPTIFDH
ncbi:hypothetical protein PCASD_18463 [Puccinia coronata f. sp. avenae]|uniref:Uncharacterized protein n=1 Tax=Puccinia coronata f. sp. avenae TaxID=200324 RepID=A0A2N5U2T2_9BASI|nr:hypothetical protein PCASD_18463 [Puccinia coronata f. sp. avenae]